MDGGRPEDFTNLFFEDPCSQDLEGMTLTANYDLMYNPVRVEGRETFGAVRLNRQPISN